MLDYRQTFCEWFMTPFDIYLKWREYSLQQVYRPV